MSTRIGQLEDALAALWVGSEEHPLLRRELLGVKIPPDTQNLSNNILEDDADAGDEEDIDEGVLANEFDALALGVGLGGGLNGDGIPSSERNRGERLGISTIEVKTQAFFTPLSTEMVSLVYPQYRGEITHA